MRIKEEGAKTFQFLHLQNLLLGLSGLCDVYMTTGTPQAQIRACDTGPERREEEDELLLIFSLTERYEVDGWNERPIRRWIEERKKIRRWVQERKNPRFQFGAFSDHVLQLMGFYGGSTLLLMFKLGCRLFHV